MDFKEINNIWQDSFKENELLDKAQIEAMLNIRKQSNTALNKIKNSFKFELIGGAIMYFIILAGILFFVKTYVVFIFIAVVSLLMGVPYYFYFKTYKKIKATVISDKSLKEALTQIIKDVEKFVNIGKVNIFKYILIPFSTLFGMLMGLYIAGRGETLLETLQSLSTKSIILMVVLLTVFTAVLIPLSIYKFKKKFQLHFDDLRKYLNEFEEADINK